MSAPLWNVAQKWAVHETMKYNHFFFSNISFEIWEWWLGEICFRSNRAIFLSSNLGLQTYIQMSR